MNLHEYQAKELMRRHGVPVPAGEPATSVEEAKAAIEKLFGEGHQRVVVKSQIHAGLFLRGRFFGALKPLQDESHGIQILELGDGLGIVLVLLQD